MFRTFEKLPDDKNNQSSQKNTALKSTIDAVAAWLCQACDQSQPKTRDIYCAPHVPDISLKKYLDRICRLAEIECSHLILMLVFVDHFTHSKLNPIPLHSLNVHRIIVVAILYVIKLFDDNFYDNESYAKIFGISNSELNSLEIDFLFSITNTSCLLNLSEQYAKYELIINQIKNPDLPKADKAPIWSSGFWKKDWENKDILYAGLITASVGAAIFSYFKAK